ncbi:hypothetical protein B0F90DRAFT_1819482 [Multifurca ochricompacta]|uniref:Uncharacterized protein n=1 Tax=Multifurca ochricompacta TaxID=376703 RepID=A0AAD4M2I8_9AGAM|nr:hypothetical protein B0F90DRAFT_1819482 [Multifurca ochricompacta]
MSLGFLCAARHRALPSFVQRLSKQGQRSFWFSNQPRWYANAQQPSAGFLNACKLSAANSPPAVLLSTFKPSSSPPSASGSAPPSSPTSGDLARSVTFDRSIARGSLLIDIVSHTPVALHISSSPLVFSGVTSISALASGVILTLQNLRLEHALCINFLRLRSQLLLFGFVYSSILARFPEAVSVLAAVLVFIALSVTFVIRSEPPRGWMGKAPVVPIAEPVPTSGGRQWGIAADLHV